jgi:acetolactate synthase small subunit
MLSGDVAATGDQAGRHTIEIRVRDQPAAVERLVGMLRHRRLRLESITVHAPVAGINRVTLIMQVADPSVVVERLHRLVDVFAVTVLESTTPTAPAGQSQLHPQSSGEHDGETVL